MLNVLKYNSGFLLNTFAIGYYDKKNFFGVY